MLRSGGRTKPREGEIKRGGGGIEGKIDKYSNEYWVGAWGNGPNLKALQRGRNKKRERKGEGKGEVPQIQSRPVYSLSFC